MSDLVKRLDQALHFEDWMPVPKNFSVAVPLLQESRNRIEQLEAKLAKAVEALDEAVYLLAPTEKDMERQAGVYRIVTTIAELKGDTP